MNSSSQSEKTAKMKDNRVPEIISSFDDFIIRLYSRIRFQIIPQSFIDDFGKHLPESGKIIDFGCGFGLFSLYYAGQCPQRFIIGVDLDPHRIQVARQAAKKLGIQNLRYEVADATEWQTDETFSGIYAFDLIHHLPEECHEAMIQKWRGLLKPGGVLIIKDVSTRPAWKRMFTYILDRLMVRSSPVHYRSPEEMGDMLTKAGLRWQSFEVKDYLPYSHILYVASVG